MTAFQSTEFAGYFSSPREPADPAVFVRVPFNFTAASAPAAADTVSLCVLPAGWIVTGGIIQITTTFGTSGVIDVGISDITAAGVIESTSDPDAYVNGAPYTGVTEACIPFFYELNSDTIVAGTTTIPTADKVVYATFVSVVTAAAGTFIGYVEMWRPIV